METLPGGYRIVGTSCIAYTLFMGYWLVAAVIDLRLHPQDVVQWLSAVAFFLSTLAVLYGGYLLLTKQGTALHAAPGVLYVAGILLLWNAIMLMIVLGGKIRTGTSPTAKLMTAYLMLVMGGILYIWVLVVLLTGILLARRLRRSSKLAHAAQAGQTNNELTERDRSAEIS
jgi:hypothetical protein